VSKSATPLAQFSRDPVLGNALKLSAAGAGRSFTVDQTITPELVAAYKRWLYLECSLLRDEGPGPRPWMKMPPTADAVLRRLVEERQTIELKMMASFDSLRCRPDPSSSSPIDRFFITAPIASTRASLVLSAVGCDWRA
jgi:hypothetical protein